MDIMFVCTGNICRSAMAHKLFEKKLKDRNIKGIRVFSCGIFAEDGDKPTYNAEEVMEEYGVDMKSHTATNIQNIKVEGMDLILCATVSHKNSILQVYKNVKDRIYTMKEYAGCGEEKGNLDIKDPWGYDIVVYRKCAAEIDRCLDLIIDKLTLNKESEN